MIVARHGQNAAGQCRDMKKALPILILLAVIVAAVAWYLSGQKIALDGTRLLPATTLFYASLPDVERSGERWRETALAKIGSDEAVKAFLEKPLEMLSSQGGGEATKILEKVDPGSLFLAVPSATSDGVDVLLGFQFEGSQADLDEAMGRLHAELELFFPVATKATTEYEGNVVTAFASPNGTLYSASRDSWGFLSSSEKAAQAALDRVAGLAKGPSLAEDEDFASVTDRLAESPEMLWFVRLQPVIDEIVRFGQGVGADTSSFESAQMRQIVAVGGTLLFDGLDQQETLFVLAPGLKTDYPAIKHEGIAFTTPETSIYFEAIQDWSSISTPEYLASLPEEVRQFLETNEIDLAKVPSWFGSDSTLVVNWATNAMVPSVLAAIAIADRPEIESAVERVSQAAGLDLTRSDLDGATAFTFPAMQIQLIDPVLAVSDKYLLGALTNATVVAALSPTPEAKTLLDAPGFAKARTAFDTPAQGFGYIDAKVVFERLYNQLRPVAMFAAAMSPDLSEKVDVSKLPETEDIAQYLRPITYLQRQVDSGWLMESSARSPSPKLACSAASVSGWQLSAK